MIHAVVLLSLPCVPSSAGSHNCSREASSDGQGVASLDKKDDKEDYHGNIGTEMWMMWLENRLIPSFKKKYPGKKMILVMGNASYHNAHEEDWVPVSNMNKEQLVKAFDKPGIESITVDRKEHVNGVQVQQQNQRPHLASEVVVVGEHRRWTK